MSNRDPADVPRGGRYFEHDDRSRDDNSDDGRKRSVEMYDPREEVSTPRDRYSNKRSYGREDYSNEKRYRFGGESAWRHDKFEELTKDDPVVFCSGKAKIQGPRNGAGRVEEPMEDAKGAGVEEHLSDEDEKVENQLGGML